MKGVTVTVLLLLIAIALAGTTYLWLVSLTRAECNFDRECVPAQCCHPTSCVPVEEAPDCTGRACTQECRAGTLDCGAGHCECVLGECLAVYERFMSSNQKSNFYKLLIKLGEARDGEDEFKQI